MDSQDAAARRRSFLLRDTAGEQPRASLWQSPPDRTGMQHVASFATETAAVRRVQASLATLATLASGTSRTAEPDDGTPPRTRTRTPAEVMCIQDR